jgi:hypothetical protein
MDLISKEQYEELRLAYKRRPLSPQLKKRIVERDGGKCLVCGNDKSLEVDHIRPWFLGGADNEGNLQTLCTVCHKIKGGAIIDCRNLKEYYYIQIEPREDDGVLITVRVEDEYQANRAIVEIVTRHVDSVFLSEQNVAGQNAGIRLHVP